MDNYLMLKFSTKGIFSCPILNCCCHNLSVQWISILRANKIPEFCWFKRKCARKGGGGHNQKRPKSKKHNPPTHTHTRRTQNKEKHLRAGDCDIEVDYFEARTLKIQKSVSSERDWTPICMGVELWDETCMNDSVIDAA